MTMWVYIMLGVIFVRAVAHVLCTTLNFTKPPPWVAALIIRLFELNRLPSV